MTATYLTKERTESTSSGTIYVSKNNKLRNGNIMRVQGKYDIIISAGISLNFQLSAVTGKVSLEDREATFFEGYIANLGITMKI